MAGLATAMSVILGGVFGSISGAKLGEFMKTRVKNAFFLIPSIGCTLGAVFLCFAINVTNFLLSVIFITFVQFCVWHYVGPIATISLSSVPATVSIFNISQLRHIVISFP